MNPTIKIDATQFQAAVRDYAIASKRELSDELNKRMFYVLLRAFVILVPHHIAAAKQKAKAYVNAVIPRLLERGAKPRKTSQLLLRVHLIAQGRRIKKGLPALLPRQIAGGKNKEQKEGVASIRRGAAAQGYVKSAIARALQSISKANLGRSFSQFGRSAKISKRTGAVLKSEQPPNAALAALAAEYGQTIPSGSQSNVGVFRGTKAQVSMAKPGFNPVITANMEGKARPEEVAKVNALLASAMQRALNDEATNLVKHMAARAQKVADKFSA